MDASLFIDGLRSRPNLEYSGVLAAGIALQVRPVMELALCNEGDTRRPLIVLPSFRTFVRRIPEL